MLDVLFFSWHLKDSELKVVDCSLLRLRGRRVQSEEDRCWWANTRVVWNLLFFF